MILCNEHCEHFDVKKTLSLELLLHDRRQIQFMINKRVNKSSGIEIIAFYTSHCLFEPNCNLFFAMTVHYGHSGVQQCTMGIQVYNSAQWAIRCMTVHYG